jgi:chaperone modulatory protein CbpM
MTHDFCDAVWPDPQRRVRLSELADLSGLSESQVVELVEYGALAPAAGARWEFSVSSISVARTARRLADDFALETHAVALLLAYLDRIRELENALRAAQAQGASR